MALSTQIAKFKFCRYQVRADSLNLMLAKIIRYMVAYMYKHYLLQYPTALHLPHLSIFFPSLLIKSSAEQLHEAHIEGKRGNLTRWIT